MGGCSIFNKIHNESPSSHPDKKGQPVHKVLLVGSPNVGKSMLFNRLTDKYVVVSNYPGTTVDLSKGRSHISGKTYEFIDTPGMYSLSAITAEEQVAVELLLNANADVVVHVIDAKNIERMLGFTLQLIEAGLNVILAINMADEAKQLGIKIDTAMLEEIIGIDVVETVATTKHGVGKLIHKISHIKSQVPKKIDYGDVIENAIAAVTEKIQPNQNISPRSKALLLLQGEAEMLDGMAVNTDGLDKDVLKKTMNDCLSQLEHSVHYHVTVQLGIEIKKIIRQCVNFPNSARITLRERLSRFCMHPLTGLPILFVVLYFGIYKFVGGFGAGTIVDFIEGTIFETYVNPWVIKTFSAIIPWESVYSLFAGEYGIVTLGIRYAIAIVLPIVGTFFIAFSILEDSGYLPRLAMLIDRLFKKIGLNGRAVIPIVLGFGCATMATMVTRTLETKREKTIASILLALAIPCSAQLGVILGLLGGHPYALLAWAGFVGVVFIIAGALMGRLFPGERPSFYMELPPLRFPRPGNVLVKTYSRMLWYFKEILPLFILASVLIWLGEITGIFRFFVHVMSSIVNLLGLPDDAATAFLFGFFRRDYGAAGLYDLQQEGLLTGNQLAVATITLTLFLPCIAQFLVFKKECGLKVALASSICILIIAFTVGFIANSLFNGLGIVL